LEEGSREVLLLGAVTSAFRLALPGQTKKGGQIDIFMVFAPLDNEKTAAHTIGKAVWNTISSWIHIDVSIPQQKKT
jgi:hypothetical protein